LGGDISVGQQIYEMGGMFVIRDRYGRHVGKRFHCDPIPANMLAAKGRKRGEGAQRATVAHDLYGFDRKNPALVHGVAPSIGNYLKNTPFPARPVYLTKEPEELTNIGTFDQTYPGKVFL
jgi:hypothetical protein